VDSDQQTDLSPVGRPFLRARLKSLSPSFCAELEDESALITNLKKDLTKEIEDDDPDNSRHRKSIDSNAVFSWKSEDERHFQSEFKNRWLTSIDQIQALCGQNAILQAEARRLKLEKAALVQRLPLERKHVQVVTANIYFPLIETRDEIQQLGEAAAGLGIEKKSMDPKTKTLEERLAREKLISETHNSLVKFAMEKEVDCRAMQFREGIWREKL
jgi:hypothetical protein